MDSIDEAVAILNWYLKEQHIGRRWARHNRADIARVRELLDPSDDDTIPPYRPIVSDRQTVVLERPQDADPDFARWRGRRYDEADDVPVRRMLRREGGAR